MFARIALFIMEGEIRKSTALPLGRRRFQCFWARSLIVQLTPGGVQYGPSAMGVICRSLANGVLWDGGTESRSWRHHGQEEMPALRCRHCAFHASGEGMIGYMENGWRARPSLPVPERKRWLCCAVDGLKAVCGAKQA